MIYVEPSSDGTVSWAARKWTLAETTEQAQATQANIIFESQTIEGEARVVVNHPDDVRPGVRYRVCLAVRAPAEWLHKLRNTGGNIEAIAPTGPVDAQTDSGAVTTNQAGPSSTQVVTTSGSVTVEADSHAPVSVTTESGAIDYTILNGGVPLQSASQLASTSSGSIRVIVSQQVGLRVDATTQSGSISVAEGWPSPTSVGDGQSLLGEIRGGGATLTARAATGSIAFSNSE